MMKALFDRLRGEDDDMRQTLITHTDDEPVFISSLNKIEFSIFLHRFCW